MHHNHHQSVVGEAEGYESMQSKEINRILSIFGICTGCIVIALVFTMINTAFPSIRDALGCSIGTMKWMMAVFGIINCAALVSSGRLADIYGRKKIYLIGLACSGVAMTFGGWCTGSAGLLLCMSFAGLGNAILLPVSQAMLAAEFRDDQRSVAISIWATAIASAMAAGPLLGGIISGSLGWQWVFWVNAPIVAISFCIVIYCSKESKNTEDPPLVDYKGMFFLAATVTAFLLMTTEYHFFSLKSLLLLFAATLAGAFLLWRNERKFTAPIIMGELFRNRRFLAASLSSACLVFYIWATYFLLPLYLQSARHLTPVVCGMTMLGITIPVALLSPLIGKLYRAEQAWLWTCAGFLLLIASTICQILFKEDSSLLFIGCATTLFGVGYSFIWGPTATAAVTTVSSDKAGIASGSFVTIQEIGGTFGLSLIVSFMNTFPDLLTGFQRGMSALLVIGVLGCLCGVMLRPKEVVFEQGNAVQVAVEG